MSGARGTASPETRVASPPETLEDHARWAFGLLGSTT